MEKSDMELIEKYRQDDQELGTLWDEHCDFERQLDKLERKPFLSPEEQQTRNLLKRRKLAGRDQIENILLRYRKNVRSAASNC